MDATLDDMEYRGEDRSRDREAWGAQTPRHSSVEHAGYDNPGYGHPGYDGTGQAGNGYDSNGYDSTGYDAGAGYDDYARGDDHRSGGHPPGGYGYDDYRDYGTGGHAAPGDGSGSSYDVYDAGISYEDTSSYDSGPYHTAPYGGRSYDGGHSGSGGYPAQESDSYEEGNDWYGQSGPIPAGGFADTSSLLAVRDPVRGYPPEASWPDPGLAATRQQLRYDESEFVSYPGYDGVDDKSRGYGPARGYDDYDDYDDATRLDQRAIDYDDQNGARDRGRALPDDFEAAAFGQAPAGAATKGGKAAKGAGKPRRRRGRTLALSLVGILILGAAGYGGYQYWIKAKANRSVEQAVSQPLPRSAPASATQQCVAQFGPFCHIQTRADDPAPLTISQLFPPAVYNTTNKLGFALAGTNDLEKDCSKAVVGSDLVSQLKKGQCTQALRASYVSDDKTIMGTIGIFNLVSTNQAHYAGKIIGGSNFLMPLSSAHGIIAKLGNGTGVVETSYKGHYLILTWAQFTSQAKLTAAQTQQLEKFENALVSSTANAYLSQRMINGDGPGTTPTAKASTSPSTKASH